MVLDVMRMDALAHRLVCPGIVNAQRISAAVEAALAALCRPVSRGWEKISHMGRWRLYWPLKGCIYN